jgi:DNA-binding CsgD family transcriptional regulator
VRQALGLLDRREALWAPAHEALVDVLVERGELEEAWATLAESGYDTQLPTGGFTHRLALARARLRLAGDDLRGGLEDLLTYGQGTQRLAFTGPAAGSSRSLAAIAYAQLGDARQARALSDEELGLARRFGEPGTLGIALRGAGMVRRGEEGIALLREAVWALATSEARLEHARALSELGAALRRSGAREESRGFLREAVEAAEQLGAAALVRRAREELLASGARPRRTALRGSAALTPSQRRVCERAAQGLTNRQIAQSLFITLSTVENHLRASYRKLGITSKDELAGVLVD